MIDLELRDLLVLVSSHPDEFTLLDRKRLVKAKEQKEPRSQGAKEQKDPEEEAETYLEDVGPEGGVGQLQDVIGPDEMEARLVLVHRVDNGLGGIVC